MRIVLVSPCGWGNLGDAAIQDSVILELERLGVLRSEISAVTQVPSDTRARHGIDCGRLESRRPTRGRLPTIAFVVLLALHDIWHWIYAVRLMKRTDILVISGGGQLDDYWGGAFGHPYSLFKWTSAARLCGARVVMLSVGAGVLRSSFSRLFVRLALILCHYRSFRDCRTGELVSELFGIRDPLVVPDLAFGHPSRVSDPEITRPTSDAPIAVSPMAFRSPVSWPDKDEAAYHSYINRLGDTVVALIAAGRSVTVFTTDGQDMRAATDLMLYLGHQLGPELLPRVVRKDTDSVSAAIAVIRHSELVIASRLHGVILSHVSARPVIALSYDWKVDQHMLDMAQTDLCLSIDRFRNTEVLDLVFRVHSSYPDRTMVVAERVATFAGMVLAQYKAAMLGPRSRFCSLGETA